MNHQTQVSLNKSFYSNRREERVFTAGVMKLGRLFATNDSIAVEIRI